MGLFDFLKKPNKSVHAGVQRAGRPECDIAQTQVLDGLFAVPKEQRDNTWIAQFLDAVQTASFACDSPQTHEGPDGFPYFTLLMPEANKAFESFCIRNMSEDFLLEKGLGVSVMSKPGAVEWVFSYGDILNLHLNKEFYTNPEPVEIQREETLAQDEEILMAQPSEAYLPQTARNVLRKHLQANGIRQPKIMLIVRKIGKTVVQELAFNIFREDYPDTSELNALMHSISWYLPRHYILVAVPKMPEWANRFDLL